MTDTEILKKIEERLKEQVDAYKAYADDIGTGWWGIYDCAEELLEQIKKWKVVSDEQKT